VTSIKLSEFLIRNSGGLGGGGEWVSNDWNGGGELIFDVNICRFFLAWR